MAYGEVSRGAHLSFWHPLISTELQLGKRQGSIKAVSTALIWWAWETVETVIATRTFHTRLKPGANENRQLTHGIKNYVATASFSKPSSMVLVF